MKDAKEGELHWYDNPSQMMEIGDTNQFPTIKDALTGNIVKIEKEEEDKSDNILTNKTNMEQQQNSIAALNPTPTQVSKEFNGTSEHQECVHQDMANTNHTPSQGTDQNDVSEDQCVHSDAANMNTVGKTVKVNRVSPFRYGDIDLGDLLIDLTDNQIEEVCKKNFFQTMEAEKTSKLKKREDDKTTRCNGYIDDSNISQERYTTDLPRHNWLVKRLKQQNQLQNGDNINLPAPLNENVNHSNDNKKDFKGIEIVSVQSLSDSRQALYNSHQTYKSLETKCIGDSHQQHLNSSHQSGRSQETQSLIDSRQPLNNSPQTYKSLETKTSEGNKLVDTLQQRYDKIPDYSQLHYDSVTVTSKSTLTTETSTTTVNITDTITPRSPIVANDDSSSPVASEYNVTDTIIPRSPTKHPLNANDTITPRSPTKTSSLNSCVNDTVTPRLPVVNNHFSSSPPKQVVENSKPKPVMSTAAPSIISPKKALPPLPGIDLVSFKYDTLTRFNSVAKQTITPQLGPRISDSYAIPGHIENRNMTREVARPVPLHLKESYKNERDAYGMNHRVRLSLTPLSTPRDRVIFRNNPVDKSSSVLKSYDTPCPSNLASPEVLKRNMAIQRQLENQKRWIAEHEPYKLNSANSSGNYNNQNDDVVNQMSSPLNPSNLNPSKFPSQPHEDMNSYNLEQANLAQRMDYLKERIDACNKEIKDIQQQKDILFARQQGVPNTDSPAHLRIISLNRKLSTLEDYRMKQSALLMKLTGHTYEQREQSSIKKPSYMNGVLDTADDNQVKPSLKTFNPNYMNQSDISDNLLLRQLQSKHDECLSVTKASDVYCRTMDLSKTSEMYYNDGMKADALRMSQPSTPMSNPMPKDYIHAGEIPPLVSAERLSPANSLLPRKPSISPGDYSHGHPMSYSQSPDMPRSHSMSLASQIQENQRSHEIMHSYKSQEISLSRDMQNHVQYQKIAAREMQHSMQLQDLSRPYELIHALQCQDRLHPRPPSLSQQELSNIRSPSLTQQEISNMRLHSLNQQQELSKSREISQMQSIGNDYLHNHSSVGPLTSSLSEPTYDEIRSHQLKENMLKRHSSEPPRPVQLKLARTAQNMLHHHIHNHNSQIDKPYPKLLQQHNSLQNNRLENKYSPSSMSSIIPPGESPVNPYTSNQQNIYDMLGQNGPVSISNYDTGKLSQNNIGISPYQMKKKIRVRTCKACDKESQFLCSGCRSVWYCSRQCQLDDWKVHSKACKKK